MPSKVVFMSDESLNTQYDIMIILLCHYWMNTLKSFKSKHLSDESLPLKRASNLWQQFDGSTNHRWVGQKNNEVIFLFGRTKKNRQSPSLSGPVARLIRCFVASRVIAVGERGGETSKKEYQRWWCCPRWLLKFSSRRARAVVDIQVAAAAVVLAVM